MTEPTPIPPRVKVCVSHDGTGNLLKVRVVVGDTAAFLTPSEWTRLISSPGRI